MGVTSDHSMSAQMDRWYSVEEIAAHLGVSRESVYRWAEHGKMPAHKVGRQWKFWVNEVNDWVRAGNATERKLKEN